jgi:signal transduction histidine kinase
LAWTTLGPGPGGPASYVLWLVPLGFLAATWIALRPLRPVPSALVLFTWCLAVQLVLIPPGFSDSFRVLAVVPVLAQTVLSLPGVWGPAAALLELGVFLAGQGERTAWGLVVPGAADPVLWGLGALGTVLIGATWALRAAFRDRDEARAELAHLKEGVQQIVTANVGFQELAVSMEQSSMRRERLRITREIHDIVGYTLTNQTMVLQAAVVLLDRDHAKLRELLDSAQESARAGLQEVRQALRQLRLGADRPQGFLNRLHQLCRAFDQATDVTVELSGAQVPDDLPPSLELVLYRMVQEGLTNAFLHGRATRVSVGMALDDDGLTLHLADNGNGAEQVTEGIGLSGMRERLVPFRAQFEYRGGPHGFTVLARIPRAALSWEGGTDDAHPHR